MNITRVKMKTGEFYYGPIWEFRPKEGYMTLVIDEIQTLPAKLFFRDIESAITENERVGILSPGVPKCEDVDELQRARTLGWNGT